MSAFLGTIWWTLLVAVVGYGVGSIFPFTKLASLFNRKSD